MKKRKSFEEIILKIEEYDDLFSYFDPREYKEKALSADFLDEIKRASRDKEKRVVLSFIIPKKKRSYLAEILIARRLNAHFKKHFKRLKKERSSIIKKGFLFILMGVIFMLSASFILFYHEQKNFLLTFIVVLLEPAGWFSFWEGLNQVIFEPKIKEPDFLFYKKMSECKINFKNLNKKL